MGGGGGGWGGGVLFFLYIYIENFKNLLDRNYWNDFSIGRNAHLVTLYQDCSSRHDSSKNMTVRGLGLFSLCIFIENFKNLLVRNHWTNFNITWQGWSFDDPRARDKRSIWVKYPYVLSKYSIIFKNLGIDTQLIWQSTQLFPNSRVKIKVSRPEKHMITIL